MNPAIAARLRALESLVEREGIIAESSPIPDDPEERLAAYRKLVSPPGSVRAPAGMTGPELVDEYRRLLGRQA
jgi:hypothetical protein